MTTDDGLNEEYRTQLREAVEAGAARETDWTAFYARLNGGAVASRLDELHRRASGGHRATAAPGAVWWEYAARAALAAVPLGLAAALLLFTYLTSGGGSANDPRANDPVSSLAADPADPARAAFESVLAGIAEPRSVMEVLIPVPAAVFLAESAGGSGR